MKHTITTNTDNRRNHDEVFMQHLTGRQKAFDEFVGDKKIPLFYTDAEELYNEFHKALPEEDYQEHNCTACRKFVNNYGRLVTITENGEKIPVYWMGEVPAYYEKAVNEVKRKVMKAKITGVFIPDKQQLGTLVTGEWTHMALKLPKEMVYNGVLYTVEQEMAKKQEDYRILKENISKYTRENISAAVNILSADGIISPDSMLGHAKWLLTLKNNVEISGRQKAEYFLWYAAATAPAGFCHINDEHRMGALLKDIRAGYSMEYLMRRHNFKTKNKNTEGTHGKPTEKEKESAVKAMTKLGVWESLLRKYARIDDEWFVKEWVPAVTEKKEPANLFANIKTKEMEKGDAGNNSYIPEVKITWDKFHRTVLPNAKKIEFYVADVKQDFCGITTAVNKSAPPIIQWDTNENRNPFAWYMYVHGTQPSRWGLSRGYCNVRAVTLQPNMWHGGFEHQGKGVIFILDGAKDQKHRGLALFDTILKSEFFEYRRTIDNYSADNELEGLDEADAFGIIFQNGSEWRNAKFRVTTDVGTSVYILDRWD